MNFSELACPRGGRRGNGGCRAGLHSADEAVTSTRQRFDESRLLSRFTEGLAQFLNGRVQAVIEIDKSVGGPKTFAQLFAGNYVSRAFQQNGQDLARLCLEADLVPRFVQFAGAKVQPEAIEDQDSGTA